MTPEELEKLTAEVTAMQIKVAAAQSHIHYDGPALQVNQASGYAKEMRKWESQHTQYGPPGRPYPPPGVSTEYPRAMFKAGHPEGRPGKIEILEHRDAHGDMDRQLFERDGFRITQEEAIEVQKGYDRLMAEEAAMRAHRDKNMSDRAKAEADAADAASASHLPEIPRAHAKTGQREVR